MMDPVKFRQFFKESQRPLIFGGNGLRHNSKNLVQVLNKLEIPLVISTHAKGSINEEEACFYGCFGFAAPDSTLQFLREYKADVMVFLGTSLGELATQGWNPHLLSAPTMIHIDIDEKIIHRSPGMAYRACGSVEDVTQALEVLSQEPTSFAMFKNYPKQTMMRSLEEKDLMRSPIKPENFVDLLSEILPEGTMVVSDIGNSMAWLMNRFKNINQHELYVPIAMGSMGSGIGMSIGAKIANPQRPVICVTGDCAMVMHGSELLTAKEQRAGVLFIVLNDGGHGMVDHGHKIIGVGNAKVRFKERVKFTHFAQAFGVQATTITNLNELVALNFDEIFQRHEPYVLDLQICDQSVPPILARARVLGQADLIQKK